MLIKYYEVFFLHCRDPPWILLAPLGARRRRKAFLANRTALPKRLLLMEETEILIRFPYMPVRVWRVAFSFVWEVYLNPFTQDFIIYLG